ncbi:MAG: hypothetical protein ABFD80_07075 [Acidobacteriota bacterium]
MTENDNKNGSVFRMMKDKARGVQAGIAGKISQASEVGLTKLKEMTDEVNEILPLIGELGYSVESIQVGVGLIPDIIIEISGLTKKMDEEAYRRILAEKEGKKLLGNVLRTLQTTSGLHDKIHIAGMKSDTGTLTLGLPPKITLKFKKD